MNEEMAINRYIDTLLMLRLKQGSIRALEILYNRHVLDVIDFFFYIGNTDGFSQDLAQEVFLSLWQKKDSFNGDSDFEEFLYGFASDILKEHRKHLSQQAKLKEDLRNAHRITTSTESEAAPR